MMKRTLGIEETNTHTVFSQQVSGWPGSNFKLKHTDIKVRRIINADRDEAQLEITVREMKASGRSYIKHSSFTLPAAYLYDFIQALSVPRRLTMITTLKDDEQH